MQGAHYAEGSGRWPRRALPGDGSGAGRALHGCNGSVGWGELTAASRARARTEAAPPRDKGRGRPGSGAERSRGARGGPSSPISGHSPYVRVTPSTVISDMSG